MPRLTILQAAQLLAELKRGIRPVDYSMESSLWTNVKLWLAYTRSPWLAPAGLQVGSGHGHR